MSSNSAEYDGLVNDRVITYLHRAMEALWLAAALLVPLAMAPPDSMISFIQLAKVALLRVLASALIILWLVEWALSRNSMTRVDVSMLREFRTNFSSRPSLWIVAAALIFMVAYLLSSVMSASPAISIWGGSLVIEGYSLYNMAAYFAIFLVTAFHIRSDKQITRILMALVAAGTLSASLGILERLQWIPLGTAFTDRIRLESTFGNAIFFGTFLMTSILATLGLFISNKHWLSRNYAFGIWSGLLALQLLALILTFSRGPWVSLAVATLVFFAVGFLVLEKQLMLKAVATLGASLIIALAVSNVLPSRPDITDEAAIIDVESRVYSIYPALTTGGLTNRVETWKSSANLIVDRPWFPSDELPLAGLRSVIGYGPELYRYAFPLEATPNSGLQMFAHNFLIHELVEVGLLGTLAFALLISAGLLSASKMILDSRDGQSERSVLLMTLFAILIAWTVEQFVGIPRPSDLVVFWIALAMLVSLAIRNEPNRTPSHDSAAESPNASVPAFNTRLLKVPAVALLIAVIGWIAIDQNVNRVRADVLVAKAVASEDLVESMNLMDKAIEIESDEFIYFDRRANIIARHINDVPNIQYQSALAERIYENRVWAAQADPLLGEAKVKLADSALDLSGYGHPDKAVEALRLYDEIKASTPHYTNFHDFLRSSEATAYLYLGQPDRGIAVLNEMLSHELDDNVKARGLFVRAIAYTQAGEPNLAINSVQESLTIESAPAQMAQAHGLLTRLYSDTGEHNLSAYHAEREAELTLIAQELSHQ